MINTSKIIKRFYNSKCTIIEHKPTDGVINDCVKNVVAQNVKCRISYGKSSFFVSSTAASSASQYVTIFLEPDINVLPGYTFVVDTYGVVREFVCADFPKVYDFHQEVQIFRKDYS